jgi:hypothetical protein
MTSWAKSGSKLGYQVHHVVAGSKARIILNALVTPSEVTEDRPMLDLLWSTVFRCGIRPRQVTGDAKFKVSKLGQLNEFWYFV